MKLCFVTYDINQVGGIERITAILSRYFTENFLWETDILSLCSSESTPFFPVGSKVRVVHGNAEDRKEGLKVEREYLLRYGENYDVIFTSHVYPAATLARIRRRLPGKVRWIATEHNSIYYYSWKYKLLSLWMYRKADHLVVLTEGSAAYYRRHGLKNVVVIPNAVSFETAEKSAQDKKRILAVGRMEGVKGYDMLLNAFASMASRYPEWKLRFLGDGVKRRELKTQAAELGIADAVEFPGFVKDVREQLLEASFLVMPSKSSYEGFPMTALEAMECGVPIVAYEMFQLREMAGDSHAVRFAEYGNPYELSRAMDELMADQSLCSYMGQEAKKRASFYHADSIGALWKKLLEQE